MQNTSPHYRMADRLAGGNLADHVLDYKAEGLSDAKISGRLFDLYGIEVTRQTVAAWVRYAAKQAKQKANA